MCTSIAMRNDSLYFGRNMDIACSFGEHVVITPRNYPFRFRFAGTLDSHYAIIGMASIAENYPLYAEAANETGLCIAGLNFPDNACYSDKESPDKFNIAVFELIPWILGKCSCVSEAVALLEKTNVTFHPFSREIQPASLHWHIADKNRSVVLEIMKDGMHIYDNPADVLTNNPPFDFHMTNLSQYANLTVTVPENKLCRQTGAVPFGKGFGSHGLPGDFSPASRFVKSAYLLANSVSGNDESENISQFFHLLESVAVVNGSIEVHSDLPYYTTYSCCVNADKGTYYFRTYWNSRISSVSMTEENITGTDLIIYPIRQTQDIDRLN